MGLPTAFWMEHSRDCGDRYGAMNIIHLHRDDLWLDHNTVMIRDRRCQHICAVLRASVGDTIRVGLLGGAQGEGETVLWPAAETCWSMMMIGGLVEGGCC